MRWYALMVQLKKTLQPKALCITCLGVQAMMEVRLYLHICTSK